MSTCYDRVLNHNDLMPNEVMIVMDQVINR
jgi:hypothetical protein